MGRTVIAVPIKRASKLGGVYALYLAIVWAFDYVYFPWLTIKFHALVFVPLYLSLFLVSWMGYYLYDFFQQEVLVTEHIHEWLRRPESGGLRSRLKAAVVRNPGATFAAIATWWSPLHAYLFFRRGEAFRLPAFLKEIAKGSFFCAFFWSVVGESCLLSWHALRVILH